jgi:hypothetical protein
VPIAAALFLSSHTQRDEENVFENEISLARDYAAIERFSSFDFSGFPSRWSFIKLLTRPIEPISCSLSVNRVGALSEPTNELHAMEMRTIKVCGALSGDCETKRD